MSEVNTLVVTLDSSDGLARQQARLELEEIGAPAGDALIGVLQKGQNPAVWEAAKALATIRTPKAAPALVETLEHNDPGVRWVAGEALIGLGARGLVPLMHALEANAISGYLRGGAHHVLNTLISKNYMLTKYDEIATPVLAALDGDGSPTDVQDAAHDAMQQLNGS